ncbi:MAG: substrate-binding domain-containing protein [Kiritimatiellae bacterium]|nr:substrate-binding domain-containing protein [Kiritimatiellia bacterium]
MQRKNVLVMVSPMSHPRMQGIARFAREHDWNLMIQDRLGYHPLAWNGDGVIATLRSDAVTVSCISRLMKRGVPVVDLTISRPDVSVPRVTSDHEAIGRLAAEHFMERNFRNVVWFSADWGNVHAMRFSGLSRGLGQSPARWVLAESLPKSRQRDWTTFKKQLRKMLETERKPVAVLSYDETDGARLLNAALELNISVPEELAILTIGNNRVICENQSVPLSSIDQNLELGGYSAAALLDRLMAGEKAPKEPQLIPPAAIAVRRSTEVVAVANDTVRAAMEYISKSLDRSTGSPQIAEFLGIRRPILDALFREHLMRSVGEEIRRQRFAKAKLLLSTTGLPIAEIARQTGFCTPSHLTNTFRSATGVTPKKWRAPARA